MGKMVTSLPLSPSDTAYADIEEEYIELAAAREGAAVGGPVVFHLNPELQWAKDEALGPGQAAAPSTPNVGEPSSRTRLLGVRLFVRALVSLLRSPNRT